MSVPAPLAKTGTARQDYVKHSDGVWRTRSPASAPQYVFSAHVQRDVFSADHFVISFTLHFPGRKPVPSFALVDSGATGSFISLDWSSKLALPFVERNIPSPVYTVDDRPLVSGMITHDVVTVLRVNEHAERIKLGVN